jgi:ADP-ribose pyrophosphatase YjhB (NUDIX family)
MSVKWLEWARRIQAISQAGLAFSKDPYDRERYEELQSVSAEIFSEYSSMDIEKMEGLFKEELGYPTPKVDVRGAVFKEGKILLVKEKQEEKWSLPGGFCEVGLSPAENVVKEIKEESGYETTPKKLLALLDMNAHPHPPQPFHYYKIFIQCELVGGTASGGTETNAVQFFSEEQLPILSTGRNTESQIHMLFEFLHHPNKEVVMD